MAIKRFSISVEEELMGEFEKFIEERGYENRSEAIRDLMATAISENRLENPDTPAIGAHALVFDHGKHLNHKLVHEQHRHLDNIVGTLHVHIDEERCFEVTVIRGTAGEIQSISDTMSRIRGVIGGKLIYKQPT